MAKSKGGKNAKGRQHNTHQGKYLRQWARTAKNKEKAWAKHSANHPNDKVAKAAIAAAQETIKRRG